MIFILIGIILAMRFGIKKMLDVLMKREELFWPHFENQAVQATFFHSDLSNKIIEMMYDPSTTTADWESLLPICRYADEWFAVTHPHIKKFYKKEDMVLTIMA